MTTTTNNINYNNMTIVSVINGSELIDGKRGKDCKLEEELKLSRRRHYLEKIVKIPERVL